MTTDAVVDVFLPASLRRLCGGVGRTTSPPGTVRQIVDDLERQFPGVRSRLCEGDRLRPGLAVAIDARVCAAGLSATAEAGCEVHFVPAIAGG